MRKEEFFEKGKVSIFPVQLSDGSTIYVKELSAKDKELLDLQLIKNVETGEMDFSNFRCKLLVKALCDENGNRLFSEEEVDALASLKEVFIGEIFDKIKNFVSIKEDFSKNLE